MSVDKMIVDKKTICHLKRGRVIEFLDENISSFVALEAK